jgi:tetratricopeptide (TPR) repeat protein
MTRILSVVTSIFFIISGCTQKPSFEQHNYQAVSAFGDTLFAPNLIPDTEAQFKSNLKAARANYQANPQKADAIIWYGRRTAYLGNYRKAIDIFSEGIEIHPKDARMYRHRGHRYITTRKYDKAIQDLEKAAKLIADTDDQIEPDGLPNEKNKPRSTLHTNIWYHLGLAYYFQGRFEDAAESFQNCLDKSTNDDMKVASSYWLYMSLRRSGYNDEAKNILDPIQREMNILENDHYHQLLLVFKDIQKPETVWGESGNRSFDSLGDSTLGYGIGNWHYINGRTDQATAIWKQVYNNGHWPAFGYIAAETDLNRIQG